MKKILFLVLLVAAGGYFFLMRKETVKVTPDTIPKKSEAFQPDPANATFTFDEEPVTLSNGSHVSEAGEETTVMDAYEAYGDINSDGKQDTIVLLSRSGGGSGVFIYAAAYVSGPVNYKGSNAVFIGDRIAPVNVSVQNGVATITYLDRGPDEAFAAEPTIKTTLQLVYKNGELQGK